MIFKSLLSIITTMNVELTYFQCVYLTFYYFNTFVITLQTLLSILHTYIYTCNFDNKGWIFITEDLGTCIHYSQWGPLISLWWVWIFTCIYHLLVFIIYNENHSPGCTEFVWLHVQCTCIYHINRLRTTHLTVRSLNSYLYIS